jgi:hypothetical protein
MELHPDHETQITCVKGTWLGMENPVYISADLKSRR